MCLGHDLYVFCTVKIFGVKYYLGIRYKCTFKCQMSLACKQLRYKINLLDLGTLGKLCSYRNTGFTYKLKNKSKIKPKLIKIKVEIHNLMVINLHLIRFSTLIGVNLNYMINMASL